MAPVGERVMTDSPETRVAQKCSGIMVPRLFSTEGVSPFDQVDWDLRTAEIKDERGRVIFQQTGCEVPRSWSQLATHVVASKYFYGEQNTPERETSVRQLVHRVTRTIADWGRDDGYFATAEDAERFYDELTALCLNQYGAFNSPVWFNVGLSHCYGLVGTANNWRWDEETRSVVKAESAYRYPQGSACFIQSVADDMQDIMRLATSEAMLFKYGSGTGTDLSTLRSSKEKLTGGGRPSGPVSFMRVYDAIASVVKSGGKTRRAAKMQTLKCWHPDILEFIECKAKEERKALTLIQAGYEANFNGEAYSSVMFQNANLSVRVTDAFLRAVERGDDWTTRAVTTGRPMQSYPARLLMDKIAEGTWLCGDPGLQYEDTIQRWHTCPNTAPINSSNPCVTGDTLLSTAEGYRRIADLVGQEAILVDQAGLRRPVERIFPTGRKPVYRLTTRSGYQVRLTADHRVFTVNRGDVPASELTKDDRIALNPVGFGSEELDVEMAEMIGLMLGDGCIHHAQTDGEPISMLTMGSALEQSIVSEVRDRWNRYKAQADDGRTRRAVELGEGGLATVTRLATGSRSIAEVFERYAILDQGSSGKRLTDAAFNLRRGSVAGLLRGLFTADGCVYHYGDKTQAISLDSASLTLLRQVQLLLLGFGIKAKLYTNRRVGPLTSVLPDGKGGMKEYPILQVHSLRISRSSRIRFEKEIGFWPGSHKQAELELVNRTVSTYLDRMDDPVASLEWEGVEDVFDLTEPVTHHFGANGLVVHNCSEYMFIDDSACNLASINLMKFRREDGTFDVARFRAACRIFITAQEILVDHASYPTDRITWNSHKFRPLGLGYANLGSLIMASGLPYDSNEGRALAGAVTAIMHGQAYLTSAEHAGHLGPFEGFALNREPMLRVMEMHRDAVEAIDPSVPADLLDEARAVWDACLEAGRRHGYRNSQVTVLAPTGCLVGDSLVLTSRGLVRLRSLGHPEGDRWQALDDVEVATDEGPRRATRFYVNGAEPVVTVETGRGYRIQGTPAHRIRVVDPGGQWQWKHLADVTPGDRVPLMLGGLVGAPRPVPLPPLAEAYWTSDHTTFVPRWMSADLAEFVGYFMGDGSLHSKGIRLCVSQADRDVVARLAQLGQSLFGLEAAITEKDGYTEVAFNSVRLVLWWEACGFAKIPPTEDHRGKGYSAHIPDAVLHSNDPQVYASFVRGLFEADGTVVNDYIAWSTVTERFSRDVQALLLALGFVTTRKVDRPIPGKFGYNAVHVLRLLNTSTTARFIAEIGLLSTRKRVLATVHEHPQAARHDHIPLTRDLVDELAPNNDHLRKTMLLSLSRHGAVSRRSAAALLERTDHPELGHLLDFFYDEVATAELGEEQFTYDLSVPDNVTYVANGFVSHNTIAFMMDCDTTGIEPDIALVKYKQLAGGGMLKIVNRTVSMALHKLGYDEPTIRGILDFIDAHDTIEGAPGLRDEHLGVFDCAFAPPQGGRSIALRGHLRMMSAVQPFLSGAISKTCNVPNDATVGDIRDAYLEGWKLGLKALAIYRDGSKGSQPVSTKSETEGGADPSAKANGHGAAAAPSTSLPVAVIKEAPVAAMTPSSSQPRRERLPHTRRSLTHKFNIQGHEGYVTVGFYPDGRPGEVFITMAKEGSTIGGLMDVLGTSISIGLQYGVPLEVFVNKFAHSRFEPAGFTQNPDIPIAKSVADYIFRWLGMEFIPGYREANAPQRPAEEPSAASAPVIKVNGHRTATIADLEHAEAIREAHQGGASPRSIASHPGEGQEKQFAHFQSDAPACDNCGALTVRCGTCYRCFNCGNSMGCS